MKAFQIIFLAVFILVACHSKQEKIINSEISILDDAFVEMLGTVPYRYHSLRPAPNDSVYTGEEPLNVAITPSLLNIRIWEKEIIALTTDANPEDRKTIHALFEKTKMDSVQQNLPVEMFKKTGRYRLFPYTKRSHSVDTLTAIGKVEFTRTYFNDQYAITVATIRDHARNGIVKLFLLEKRETVWHKKEEYIIQIW